MGFNDGPNRYVYCGNNPVNFRDPNGLDIDNRGGMENVYYKDEKTGKVWNVPRGTYYNGRHDAVIEPSTGDVYKTPGKSWIPFGQDNVVIDENGKIHDVTDKFNGGRKDKKWLEDLQEQSDDEWNELFRYSDLIKEKKKECE